MNRPMFLLLLVILAGLLLTVTILPRKGSEEATLSASLQQQNAGLQQQNEGLQEELRRMTRELEAEQAKARTPPINSRPFQDPDQLAALREENCKFTEANASLTKQLEEAKAKIEILESELASLRAERARALAEEFIKTPEARDLKPEEREIVVEAIKSLGEIPHPWELKPLAAILLTHNSFLEQWNRKWEEGRFAQKMDSEEARALHQEKLKGIAARDEKLLQLLGPERAERLK